MNFHVILLLLFIMARADDIEDDELQPSDGNNNESQDWNLVFMEMPEFPDDISYDETTSTTKKPLTSSSNPLPSVNDLTLTPNKPKKQHGDPTTTSVMAEEIMKSSTSEKTLLLKTMTSSAPGNLTIDTECSENDGKCIPNAECKLDDHDYGTCQCLADFVSENDAKCSRKLDTSCKDDDECVENAQCHSTTKKCQCLNTFTGSADQSKCTVIDDHECDDGEECDEKS